MNYDFVSRWYDMRKFVYDDVEKKYGSSHEADIPVTSYIVMINDLPAGYVQTYKVDDYPAYADAIAVHGDVAGMDMFIGDRDFMYKGYGKTIVDLFVKTVIFAGETVNRCIAGVEPTNDTAIKTYKNAGFMELKTAIYNENEELILHRRKGEDHIIYRGDGQS